MNDFITTAGESHHAALWPLILAALGMLGAMGASALLAALPRGFEASSRRKIAVGISLAAGAMLSVLIAGSPLVFVMVGLSEHQGDYVSGDTALGQFLPHIFAGAMMPVTAVLTMSTGYALHLGHEKQERSGPTGLLTGALVLCTLLMALGWAEAQMLVARGPLPHLAASAGPRIHVGQEVEVEPDVRYVRDPGAWRTHGTTVKARKPGAVKATVSASRFPVTVRKELTLEAGLDRGSPLLPLAVGNTWVYTRTDTWTDVVLVVKAEHRERVGDPIRFEITDESFETGLHVYTLTRTKEKTEPASTTVYAWNGEVVTEEGVPFITVVTDDDSCTVERLQKIENRGDVICRTGLFAGFTCRCLDEPMDNARLPGPSLCFKDPTTADGLKDLAGVLLGLATVGMAAPDFTADTSLELVESGISLRPAPP